MAEIEYGGIKVGGSKLASRSYVLIKANPANIDNIYIGFDSSVTTSSYGYILAPNDGVGLELDPSDAIALYAISGSSTQYIRHEV